MALLLPDMQMSEHLYKMLKTHKIQLPVVTLSNIDKLIVTVYIDQINAPLVQKR